MRLIEKLARKALIKVLQTFQDLIKAYYISKYNKTNEKVHWNKTH